MTAAIVAATFQHIYKALQIGINIGMRIIDRMTHAGLGRQMHHIFEPVLSKQLRDRGPIGELKPHEAETRIGAKQIQS